MSRTLKEPEVRRKEIIEISRLLFEEKGFENTSVENIINAANIAKGTFYYYFKTKKDVLDEVVKDISEDFYVLLHNIVKSQSRSVVDKINQIFIGSKKESIVNTKVMKSIHMSENRELQEKLNIIYIEKMIPLITEVFNQGYKERLWNREISIQAMQIILGGAQFILDSGLFTLSKQERKTFFPEIQAILEYAVGAAPGTFDLIFNELN